VVDGGLAEAHGPQLPPVHYPVLAFRQLPDQPVGIGRVTLTLNSGVDVTGPGHGPIVTQGA
jgi:hypothetical protein